MQCLQSWRDKWPLEMNVEKSAMNAMRKTRVDKRSVTCEIGVDEICCVSSYKY